MELMGAISPVGWLDIPVPAPTVRFGIRSRNGASRLEEDISGKPAGSPATPCLPACRRYRSPEAAIGNESHRVAAPDFPGVIADLDQAASPGEPRNPAGAL